MAREIKNISCSTSADGLHTIEFNEASHRYKIDGKSAVGTTTFIKAASPVSEGLLNYRVDQGVMFAISSRDELDGLDLIKEARNAWKAPTQEAADIGTICHAYAELHSLGHEDKAAALLLRLKGAAKESVIKECVSKYLAWSEQNQGELVAAENLIASPTYLYCGKFDRLDRVNGKLRLRDYKTSKAIYADQYIQLAAYALAIREWMGLQVDELEVLRFGKDDGAFETLLISDPDEIAKFTAQAIRCRETYEFLKINSDPRFDWRKR